VRITVVKAHRRGYAVACAGHTGFGQEEETVADPSFDVVSKVDRQEVDNALNQAAKELSSGSTSGHWRGVSWSGEEAVTIEAETEERCRAAIDVFKEKLIKRGISMKAFEVGDPAPSGRIHKVTGTIVQGIASEKAKEISKTSGTRSSRAFRRRSRATSCGCPARRRTTCRP